MRPIRVRRRSVFILASKEPFKFCPRKAVQDLRSFKSGAAGLIHAAADQVEFAGTVRIGGDGNHDAYAAGLARDIGVDVEPVGAGIDFQKTPVLARVGDHPVHVDLVARTLEQQAACGVTKNR